MKKLLFTLLMLLTFSIGFAQKNVLIHIDAGHNLVDVSMLPDGMYFLKMTRGSAIKIIKNS